MKKLIVSTGIALALLAGGIAAPASAAPTTTIYPIVTTYIGNHPENCPSSSTIIPDYNDVFGPGSTVTLREYISAPGRCTFDLVLFVP